MYEESVAVPFIISGPDIPSGKRVVTPVSLVDVGPTIIEFNGESVSEMTAEKLPGINVMSFVENEEPDRAVFSEYHAIGSVSGTFMIRTGKWKYVYYSGYPSQLFDLEEDPEELLDLGTDPEFETIRLSCHKLLLNICDPDEQSARAFSDQASRISEQGGIEAVLNQKIIPYTPAPSLRS
jgi:choline-sulfatase